MQDEVYMARALKLAQRGIFTTHPNPSVGCVIVKNNKIIGEGFHYRAGEPHAEIHALHVAGEKAKGSTVYVTLEPCNHYGRTSPCCDALIKANVFRVVAAINDPNPQVNGRGFCRLQKEGIKVDYNIMMSEAERINKRFLKLMRTGLPYVQLKISASLDGCTAMKNGESKWITSLHARKDVQRIRAKNHAILTSSTTVLNDNPALTVRWNEFNIYTQKFYPRNNIRQPIRIVIDSRNRVTPKHNIVHQSGETWFARIKKDNRSWPKNVHHILVSEKNGHLNLRLLLQMLGERKINSVLVEAGPTLSGAFLQSGLVDEIIIYLAPKLLGTNTLGLCVLPGIKNLTDAMQLSFRKIRSVGPDLCLHMIIIKSNNTNY